MAPASGGSGGTLRRAAALSAALVLGIGIGVALEAWRARSVSEWIEFSDGIGRSYLLQQHAALQFCEAPVAEAREALEQVLAYLQGSAASGAPNDPLLSPTGIALDTMLTRGRLALLDERAGDGSAAAEQWRQAATAAGAAGWEDTSNAAIRAAVERLDPCGPREPARR